MYADLLRNKILDQQTVYESLKADEKETVCYKELKDPECGTKDANYTNRMRLAYYLLYENIVDEEVIAYLFKEELKDRETNSFQGIGNTIHILTYLLRKCNAGQKYDDLFDRAKNANFDCACGYDVNFDISEDIYDNDLMDCIYLCWDLDYKDVMEQLVDEWKESVEEWNNSNRTSLIRFNSFLNRETENEVLYKELMDSAISNGKIFDIVSAYNDLIQYYLRLKKYETAYIYLDELLETVNYKEIKGTRLFRDLLEAAFEIICNCPNTSKKLWKWAKTELRHISNRYGNLYTKGIAAAKADNDSYAEQLEKEYSDWCKEVGLDKGRSFDGTDSNN